MDKLFTKVSFKTSEMVTRSYSTSFSWACRLLGPSIRPAIYAIYGFVRFADEIVDTFHEKDQALLLDKFEADYYQALQDGLSLNPILNAFQSVVREYNIEDHLVQAFLSSMRSDLHKSDYNTKEELKTYIYGSADVVGLMCLKVFLKGDQRKYDELKDAAMSLGSAFQKVNFLRDLNYDTELLNRTYFPGVIPSELTSEEKSTIIKDIESDFDAGLEGLKKLPKEARLGVFVAYKYYSVLLKKLKKAEADLVAQKRVRVSNPIKMLILGKSYIRYKLNFL